MTIQIEMQREMQRAKEREKERETLASPVTPVRSVKVKDISLYSSATRGPMCRIGKSPSSSSSPLNLSLGWISMFTTKGNYWRSVISITLSIFQQWNGVGIISYYLVQVLSSVGIDGVDNQTLINGFYSFGIFFGQLLLHSKLTGLEEDYYSCGPL